MPPRMGLVRVSASVKRVIITSVSKGECPRGPNNMGMADVRGGPTYHGAQRRPLEQKSAAAAMPRLKASCAPRGGQRVRWPAQGWQQRLDCTRQASLTQS